MKELQGNGAARAHLSPRITAELNELHRRTVELDASGRALFKRRLRRERRDARYAEADLLRGLGFASYDEFVRVSRTVSGPHGEVEHLSEITMLHARISLLEEELAEAKFAIKSMGKALGTSEQRRQSSGSEAELEVLRGALDDAAREVTLFSEAVRREGEELARAREAVVAMTRDARVTVEGLRRIADLDDPGGG
jgi:hypothetical protein